MHLNKKEMEALYRLLRSKLICDSYLIPEGLRWDEWLAVERNLFRRIKEKLGEKISEEDALIMGLADEVSKETLEKFASLDSDKPLISREPIAIMAVYLLKSKKESTSKSGVFYYNSFLLWASLSSTFA